LRFDILEAEKENAVQPPPVIPREGDDRGISRRKSSFWDAIETATDSSVVAFPQNDRRRLDSVFHPRSCNF
jgi:hypothetical protein